jgi:transcription elongation factor SPT5
MKLVEDGRIQPVIYKEDYWGLEAVSRALEDVKARKAWGRSVVRICEGEEKDNSGRKARL